MIYDRTRECWVGEDGGSIMVGFELPDLGLCRHQQVVLVSTTDVYANRVRCVECGGTWDYQVEGLNL